MCSHNSEVNCVDFPICLCENEASTGPGWLGGVGGELLDKECGSAGKGACLAHRMLGSQSPALCKLGWWDMLIIPALGRRQQRIKSPGSSSGTQRGKSVELMRPYLKTKDKEMPSMGLLR